MVGLWTHEANQQDKFNNLWSVSWIDSTLTCFCSEIDHRSCQNVLRTRRVHKAQKCASLMSLPCFVVFYDPLMNKHMATWNLVVFDNNTKQWQLWCHLRVCLTQIIKTNQNGQKEISSKSSFKPNFLSNAWHLTIHFKETFCGLLKTSTTGE